MTRIGLLEMDSTLEEPLWGTPEDAVRPPCLKFDQSHDFHLIAETLTGDGEAFAALMRPYLYLFTSGTARRGTPTGPIGNAASTATEEMNRICRVAIGPSLAQWQGVWPWRSLTI